MAGVCWSRFFKIVDLAGSSLWVDKYYQLLSFLLLCEVRLGLMKKIIDTEMLKISDRK